MTTNYDVSGTVPNNCGIDSAVSRVSNSITEVAQKAHKVANGTIHTAVIARDGMDKANQAIVGLRKIACVMSDLAAMIGQLSLHSEQLRDIPEALEYFNREVSEITGKHLLQDNLESTAVRDVKAELVQITNVTASRIKEISQQIHTLSDEIESCVSTIDDGIRQVEEGHRAAYSSFAVLDEVLDTLEDNSIKIDQILTAAEEVSVSGSEMINVVNRVVAEINSSAQYITHISGKLRKGTVSAYSGEEASDCAADTTFHPFVSEDLLLT